ncbi:hypothetical protein C6I20_04330 [Aeromicrobium sp. A1-2]|nr:hypothetical protein C6I20_04330 [Aeromicrobium sp. A1-2]
MSLRTLFVAVSVIVVAFHLAAVTLAALPPNRYSDAAAPRTGYLQPFFTQNWRLFAPNPVAEDRSVLFQGSYVAADGSTRQTAWVDWTEVELDLIQHRIVGGRAGYVTNKMFPALQSRYAGLGTNQRQAATSTSESDPPDWAELRSSLGGSGRAASAATGFLRYEKAVTRLATDVLMARWPERDITSVRYTVRRQGVVPYADRGGSTAERAAARPEARDRVSGWRVPSPGPTAELDAVAEFDRRHR